MSLTYTPPKSNAHKAGLSFCQHTTEHTCHVSLLSRKDASQINFQLSIEDTERMVENLLRVLTAERLLLSQEIVKLKDDLDDMSGQLTDCNQRD